MLKVATLSGDVRYQRDWLAHVKGSRKVMGKKEKMYRVVGSVGHFMKDVMLRI